jgi:hypothetical protein
MRRRGARMEKGEERGRVSRGEEGRERVCERERDAEAEKAGDESRAGGRVQSWWTVDRGERERERERVSE